jgi:hypothetical protein
MLGHVDPLGGPEGALVIGLGIVAIGLRDVIPAWMIRVERHRPIGQRAAALEGAGMDQQDAHQGRRIGIARIQRQHAIDRVLEGVAIAFEETEERARFPGVLIERVELERAIQSPARARQRVRPRVEAKPVLVQIQMRERRKERRHRRIPPRQHLEMLAQDAVLAGIVLAVI